MDSFQSSLAFEKQTLETFSSYLHTFKKNRNTA